MAFKRWSFVLLLLGLGGGLGADEFPELYNSGTEEQLSPMPAEEAAATLRLPTGFKAQVFACEPDVQNPIAMAWDDQGRMWVAENYTYAERQLRFDLSLRDRVVTLEDTDADGRADRRRVFTDQVQMLTSVEVGRGGVWLMCPPQLLFIPDADADGVADGPAQVKLDGFTVAQDNYHNFANGLRWGPDGWLYGRCGHSCPGRIGLPGASDAERIPLSGGIWRFHPERQTVEVLCHGTVNPWGHDWDQHGELFFINTVIGHLWHSIPGAHFRESFGESLNPLVYQRMDMIADHYHFDTGKNWTDSRNGNADAYGGGHAHIGMMIYQGNTWPEAYRNRLFTLNMHGRRANVERLERLGAGYVGRHEPDFLLAQDPFFRGMEIQTGPDGNVFVLDWSDAGECHEHTGVHRTSGRIYKISYGPPQPARPVIKPACMAGDSRLARLWRDYQTGRTTPDTLRELLRDEDEHLRVWAIRLLTDHWPLDTIVGPRAGAQYPSDPKTVEAMVRMASEDRSGLVLLTLASTMQRLPLEARPQLAQRLVQRDAFATDRDLPRMVWYGLIPVGQQAPDKLVSVATNCHWPTTLQLISRFLASRSPEHPGALDALVRQATGWPEAMQTSVVAGMAQAYQGWRKAEPPESWTRFIAAYAQRDTATVQELNRLFGDGRAMEELRRLVNDGNAELQMRKTALQAVIDARPDDLRALCESLLGIRHLNATAVGGLILSDDPKVGQLLARSYRRFHPDDRPVVLEALISRPVFADALLDEIARPGGQISRADVNAFHARQILSFGDDELSKKLSETWGQLRPSSADHQARMAEMRGKLTAEVLKQANLSQGRALFTKSCGQCHRLFGEGGKVGPDLTGSQRANLDYLLDNVLDPSAVVGKDYRMSIVVTIDGRVLNGLVVSRGERTLVLQTPTAEQTLAMEDIDEIRPTTLSSMPDGLLNPLSDTEVRDLIGYLMSPLQVPLP